MDQDLEISETRAWPGQFRGEWDAAVIGAGVAGAVAALALARRGARVLLVEKSSFPRAKVCGACLNSNALRWLAGAGLADVVHGLGGNRIDRFCLRSPARRLTVALPEGLAVSRQTLDAALVQAAIRAGAMFLPRAAARVEELIGDRRNVVLTRTDGTLSIACKTVIVAAGLGSRCLDDTGEWRKTTARRARMGAGCQFDVADDFEMGTVFMAVGRAGYAGLVRVEEGRLNVAAALDRQAVRRHGSPARAVAQILAQAGAPVPRGLAGAAWHGTDLLTQRTRPLASRRVFLIGDAAGYVEPFTGEGIAWGLATGLAVADWVERALAGWTPELERGWAIEYSRLVRRRQRICNLVRWWLRFPRLVSLGVSAAGRWPALAEWIVADLNRPTLARGAVNAWAS